MDSDDDVDDDLLCVLDFFFLDCCGLVSCASVVGSLNCFGGTNSFWMLTTGFCSEVSGLLSSIAATALLCFLEMMCVSML